MFPACRINGGPFEEEKPLMTSHGSHELEDEDGDELVAEEKGKEPGNTPEKPDGEELPGSLSEDVQEDSDLSGSKDLTLNCKTSPRR